MSKMSKVNRPDPLWTIDEVAALFRVSKQTLYTWRKQDYGPRAVRVGRHLRYNGADVLAFYHQVLTEVA